MLYTDLTKKAIRLSFEAHKGQTDKCGLPYVTHPLHLAEQMPDEITLPDGRTIHRPAAWAAPSSAT